MEPLRAGGRHTGGGKGGWTARGWARKGERRRAAGKAATGARSAGGRRGDGSGGVAARASSECGRRRRGGFKGTITWHRAAPAPPWPPPAPDRAPSGAGPPCVRGGVVSEFSAPPSWRADTASRDPPGAQSPMKRHCTVRASSRPGKTESGRWRIPWCRPTPGADAPPPSVSRPNLAGAAVGRRRRVRCGRLWRKGRGDPASWWPPARGLGRRAVRCLCVARRWGGYAADVGQPAVYSCAGAKWMMGEPSTAPVLQYSEAPAIGGRLCLALSVGGKMANAALACRGFSHADAARRERSGLRWRSVAVARPDAPRQRRSLTASAVVRGGLCRHAYHPSTHVRTPTVQLRSHSGQKRDVRPAPSRLIVSFFHEVTCTPRPSACCGRAILPQQWSIRRHCSCFSHPPLLLSSFFFLVFVCFLLSFPACHALPQRSFIPRRAVGSGGRR